MAEHADHEEHGVDPNQLSVPSRAVQPRLVVGATHDPLEREAEATADLIMRRLSASAEVAGDDADDPPLRRIGIDDDPGFIGAAGGGVDHGTERAISSSHGVPLDGATQSSMASAFGADFSAVRVHTGPKVDDLNQRLSAKAFTTGSDIFVRSSDFSPRTTAGQRLLAHELTHVVQQGGADGASRIKRRAPRQGYAGRGATTGNRVRRDIAPGAALPDFRALGAERATKPRLGEAHGGGFVDVVAQQLADPKALTDWVQEYSENPPGFLIHGGFGDPTLAHALAAQQTLADLTLAAQNSANGDDKTANAMQIAIPGDGHPHQIAFGFLEKCKTRATEIAAERGTADFDAILDRPEGADFGAAIPGRLKKAFSAALRQLPAVAALTRIHAGEGPDLEAEPMREQRHLAGGITIPGPTIEPSDKRWSDGGWLHEKIATDATDNKGAAIPEDQQLRRPIDDGTFKKTVLKTDRLLRLILDPEIIAGITRPTVRVHPLSDKKFRAYQKNDEVHVAADEPADVIAHEVGHYIESNGSLATWADIHKLIESRHAAAGGGGNAAHGPLGMRQEGRFKGSYPVTGKYTSKAYDTGDTEVMSMTIEYLVKSKKSFDKLLNSDPVQAAVILRGLEPTAYQAVAALRDFDEYLPS